MEQRHAVLSVNKNSVSFPFGNRWILLSRTEDQGKLGKERELTGCGNPGWCFFPVSGNIYSNLIKEHKTLRNCSFHMIRKEVALNTNTMAKKIWMHSVFNFRIQTAEHSYWVHRLDAFWAWMWNGRNCYLPCQYLPTSANEVNWVQEDGLIATSADCCPEKLDQQLTQP